jgi:hypothetical protein
MSPKGKGMNRERTYKGKKETREEGRNVNEGRNEKEEKEERNVKKKRKRGRKEGM